MAMENGTGGEADSPVAKGSTAFADATTTGTTQSKTVNGTKSGGKIMSNAAQKMKLVEDENGQFKVEANESEDVTEYSLRDKIYLTMTYPSYSTAAGYYSIFMILIVGVSMVQLIISSYASLTHDDEWRLALFIIDAIISGIFTIDYVIKFALCRDRIAFVFDPFNVIDLLSFLPFYLELGVASSGISGLSSLRILRVLKVLRMFRLSRNLAMLQMLFAAVNDALVSIALFFFIIFLFAIIAGSTLFYIETSFCFFDESTNQWIYNDFVLGEGVEEPTDFQDIMISMYWAIVTVTTVGYGDTFPVTFAGRLVGSCVLGLSIVVLALPITLVGSTFSRHYDEMKAKTMDGGISFSVFQTNLTDKMRSTGEEMEGRRTWESLLGDGEGHLVNKVLQDMSARVDEQERQIEEFKEELDKMFGTTRELVKLLDE